MLVIWGYGPFAALRVSPYARSRPPRPPASAPAHPRPPPPRPRRRYASACARVPVAHALRTGHSPHFAILAVQTSAPSSMIA
jgi:hypothetical protein